MAQTTFYSQNYRCWPPVHISEINNPDSNYWYGQYQAATRKFDALIPPDIARQFIHYVLDHFGNTVSNKDAAEIHMAAVENYQPGVTAEALAHACGILPESNECSCNGINKDACSRCRGEHDGEELEF